ncbi:nucleoside/nucleotide kinase family protein [uncultured Nocardioides sp.]|uniref:Uridine kinase family protein YggC homolog n=1 Tax=uncultured Nocardioides sp. TaxID=198441 RepID=A0A6J4NK52_9ACTN|nr:nucleoside/nucleotide kinase family protein [uncultured Nocardioides sp.]CAA9388092.1 MAG: Uridine kinase family protein YggC homolog [uncultured Nocardioides sp.]
MGPHTVLPFLPERLPMTAVDTLSELTERARALTGTRSRTMLGLTGAPGSGKSTLARDLVEALTPHAVVVPMDGFHLSQGELVRLGRQERKGAPDTFDAAGYVALLRRLRRPGPDVVYAPAFDRDIEEPVAGSIPVAPDTPLVITEGNYLLLDDGAWSGVRENLDEVWFLEVDPELRIERLVTRHVRHGKRPDAARAWVTGSDEINATVVGTTRAAADLVVTIA